MPASKVGLRIVISLTAVVFVSLAAETARAQDVPRFEPGECPFEGGEWLEEENITCGDLIVLENRESGSERTLRLKVAVAHSLGEDPRPDPVIWLQGGPGGSTLNAMRGVSRSESRLTS